MITVVFTYNGTDTVTAVVSGAANGDDYVLIAEDGDTYPENTGTVSGGTVTLTVTVNPPAGYTFDALVQEGTSAFTFGPDYTACTVFEQGTASEFEFDAVWAFDGSDTVSVTGTFDNGVNYTLQLLDTTNGGTSQSFTGTGAPQVVTRTTASPAGGAYFFGGVYRLSDFATITDRLFTAGVADAGTPGNPDGAAPPPPPPPPVAHVVTIKIYDLASNELADITTIALEKTLKRRHNQARSFVIQARSAEPLLTAIAGDGYPTLRKGNRKVVVWEDEDPAPIFHGRIFTVERTGDGTKNMATITAFEPRMELGYEADDRAGRPVRDDTGNFIDPTFVSSVGGGDVISGPDLIQQVLTNSQGPDSEGGANPGEGPLPIDVTSGTFDLAVPPAVDLSVVDSMDWPVLCGDFIQQLVDTGVVDVDERPLDPGDGINVDGDPDPYIMTELSAVSSQGSDRSATVHFDYWTGSKNAVECRHVEDFTTINNKLYDYLGPRIDKEHWRANITPGSPGTTVDPSASRTLYGGQFMSIRVFDSIGDEASNRPLYIALWNAEQGYRVEPRDLLFITPAPGDKALFQAPQDFDVGDLVAINVGPDFGITLADAQRVYGYDKTWDRQGVARLSQLLTSADVG